MRLRPFCPPTRFALSRRALLQVGVSGLVGASLPQLLRAQHEPGDATIPPRADAYILLLLNGGPSHLDTFDPKPDAPAEVRGDFDTIQTTVSGLRVCEQLPRLARLMDRCTLVRSMNHRNVDHPAAIVYTMTGEEFPDRGVPIPDSPKVYPSAGAVLSKLRRPDRKTVAAVTLPHLPDVGGVPFAGYHAGFLGRRYDPLFVLQDPASASFSVDEFDLPAEVDAPRLAARRDLLEGLRSVVERGGTATVPDAIDAYQQQAFDLLTSGVVRNAMRISDEPDVLRDEYGRNTYGQSMLLARRLIEAGTRVVTINWATDGNGAWDTHAHCCKSLKERLLPPFDQACAALLRDLADRGLLERTIVAAIGDFGRTPKIGQVFPAGREHWPWCYSIFLAGGGFKQGYVHGASDRMGEHPTRDAVAPGDLISTIYHALGIRHDAWLDDMEGRPRRLVEKGDVVPALLA